MAIGYSKYKIYISETYKLKLNKERFDFAPGLQDLRMSIVGLLCIFFLNLSKSCSLSSLGEIVNNI